MTVAWRTDEPRLTAADVDGATFPRTPWGRRGYDEAAVDDLLGRVTRELQMCANEATGLREEAMRLRAKAIASQRGKPGDWLADASEAHVMAVKIVSEAQVTADRYVTDAREYAGRLTQDAQGRREEMLAEAERVLADARAQARNAASVALDEPVPEQAHGPLRAARAAAAYQGTFNGVYLTHVSLLVDTLQQMLSDWKRKELDGGPGPGAADPSPAPRGTALARKETS
jgi:DivIVA domain-containing protein